MARKASPSDVRKSLQLVDLFKIAGIGFVPMPVLGSDDQAELFRQVIERLEAIEKKP